MNYYDTYSPYYGGSEQAIILLVYMLVLLIFSVPAVINYVLTAIAYMRIAFKRGIKQGWLAWIPVAESYVVGRITQSYDEERGIERKWGKILVIAYAVGYGVFLAAYMSFLFGLITVLIASGGNAVEVLAGSVAMLVFFYILLLVAVLAMNVYATLRIICTYKVLEGMAPEKAVKYTILGACVPFAAAIILMKCAGKIPDMRKVATEVIAE